MATGCGDVLSLEDLQIAKKHQLFEAEVITGLQGGVAGGASIDYATNQVTGQTQKTMPAILRDIGFTPASFDFLTGGTIETNQRDIAVLWPLPSGDGDWYYWEGSLPKIIPANSTPATTGGVVNGAWRPVGDITLRGQLISTSDNLGDSLIGVKQPFTGAVDKTQHDKNRENLDASDFGALPSLDDNSQNLNKAFEAMRTKGGGTIRITVPGVYKISGQLTMYANTKLEMSEGVIIRRNYTASTSMFSFAQGQASNSSVIGGTFDGNAQNMGDAAFDIMGSTGNTNLLISGVTFMNVCDFHCIDIAAWQRVVIRDCLFTGFKLVDPTRNYSEAIQLDPGLLSAGSYVQSNDLLVENCIVQPNSESGLGSFGALIGNHATSYGVQDNNIRIINCKAVGCLFAGVRVFNWSNWLVQGCTFMDSTSRGIHVTPLPSSVKPQGSRHGKIIGNTFLRVRAPVLFATPPFPFTDISDIWHDYIEISDNSMEVSEPLGYAIDARWCRNLIVSNNVGRGGLGLFGGRFIQKCVIKGNVWSDATNNGVWVTEADSTSFIGTGLSGNVIISDNVFTNISYNGVHINGKYDGFVIKGNIMFGVSTASNTRSGVNVDSASSNGIIEGNNMRSNGAAIGPDLGIRVTSACSNVQVYNNSVYGNSPINNQATGESGVSHLFSTRSPSTIGMGAPIGSIYTRKDGGAGTTLYIKESGTDSNGWVAK